MRSGWRILLVMAVLLVLAASLVQAVAAENYQFVTTWGAQGEGDGQFSMPMGVAYGADRVYVVDTDNDRVQVFDTAGTFVKTWGTYGTGDGQFSLPFGIAVDADGNVYVTDALNNRTQKFSSDGDYLAQWGGPGTGNGQFILPTGIAVDAAGNVYVADYGNDRVQKFTSDGAFLAEYGGLIVPVGIAVNADGSRVYVSDGMMSQVRILDSTGAPLGSFGGFGTGDGQFGAPYFVAVDTAGSVYVSDSYNNRVQKFTPDGDFVATWGSRGTGDGQFDKPTGIAVDSAGAVYVADSMNNRIQKFASAAAPAANFTANVTEGEAPLTVAFMDTSTGDGIANWTWDFGDGGSSTETNPAHTYTAAGNYTVNLTVTGAGGTDSAVRNVYVRDALPPIGGDQAYYLVSTVPAGAEIYFRSLKGDLHLQGTTGAGPLNVTLFLTGSPETQIVARIADYRDAVWNITQYPAKGETVPVNLALEPLHPLAPVANFTANVTSGTAPLAVAFTDSSTGDGIANWTWDFGDGETSTEQNPVHVYASPGNYTVNLTVANAGGSDSEEKAGYITVTEPPITDAGRSYYLVSTVPAGAEIFFEALGGTRYHLGDTSAGPLNITLCRTCTPVRKIVATLPGYLEAAYAITAYPAEGETVPVALTLERGTDAPFPGPHVPATVIQAEDFDTGGEGVAYHDLEPRNLGGAYRPAEGVDIETGNGVTDVGWIRSGEYLTYTVDTTIAGYFRLTLRAANPDPARKPVLVLLDGTPVTEVLVASTGSWTSYAEFGAIETLPLHVGRHTVTLAFEGTERINLDWLLLAAGQVPAGGGQPYPSAHAVPGRVEAEDYDTGGFADTTPANEGGAYRNDAVDIERGGSNYDVGWIRPGEYLQYSVDAAEAGTYAVSFRVANPGSAMPVTVLVNGWPRPLTVPATGSFGAWQTATLADVPLAAGRNTVRVEVDRAGSFNLDYLEVSTGAPTPTVTATPTGAAGASFTAAPLSASRGSAVKFTLSPAAGKTVKSAWWSFDAPAHLTTWNSRAINPTFFYPVAGSFSPYVKITYTDNSVEEVRRVGYIRAVWAPSFSAPAQCG